MSHNHLRTSSTSTVIILLIFLACWFSRLENLTLLPVFVDEAIMFRYAQYVSNWPAPLELPSIDSKWFYVWLLHLILPLASDNALWFGRFLSVITGLLACLGCYRLGEQIFGRSVGLLSAALYVLSPFSLWNDRLAAADSLTGALFLLSWSTALKLVTDPRATIVDSLLCGLSVGLASLTKAINTMALLIPIICLLVYRKKYVKRARRLVALAYLPALLLSSPVLISLPYHATLIERHTVAGTSLAVTTNLWLRNLKDAAVWLSSYLGYTGLLLILVGLCYAAIRPRHEMTLLTVSVGGPLAILIIVSKNWFPRYFTPVVGPAYVMIGRVVFRSIEFARKKMPRTIAVQLLKRKTLIPLLTAILVVICWQLVSFDWWIMTNPPDAPLPAVDLKQYVQGWPAGYGVPEASRFLLHQADAYPTRSIQVVRNYLFDPLFPGLEVYLNRSPSIELHVTDLSKPDSVIRVSELSEIGPTFIVLNQPRVPFPFEDMYGTHAELVAAYPKPGGISEIQIWQLK